MKNNIQKDQSLLQVDVLIKPKSLVNSKTTRNSLNQLEILCFTTLKAVTYTSLVCKPNKIPAEK